MGSEAPLDWIEEHLTSVNEGTHYRRALQGGVLLEKWFVPEDWQGVSDNPERFVLKVQPFAKGGYEATVRLLDLAKIGDAMERDRKFGKREAPEQLSQENLEKAAQRAKRKMRLLVKNMRADHLHTLTKREGPNTRDWTTSQWESWESGGRDDWEASHGAFTNPEQWAVFWDKYRRLLTRVIGEFPYVAILEKHRKGDYHLHVAWCGRTNVNLCRKLWLLALGGGRGCGNIDIKPIKVKCGGDRASRIAHYISKYVAKHFDVDPRFNKKRYWASRQTLEDVRRYVLEADTLDGAMDGVRGMLGLDFAKFIELRAGKPSVRNLFFFPDGSGFWLSYIPELHGTSPPF